MDRSQQIDLNAVAIGDVICFCRALVELQQYELWENVESNPILKDQWKRAKERVREKVQMLSQELPEAEQAAAKELQRYFL